MNTPDATRRNWLFSVRYYEEQVALPPIERWAVVGPARSSTVDAALRLAKIPEAVRVEIRANAVVRDFVEGRLDPDKTGYYTHSPAEASRSSWAICIGSVHEVLR